MNSPDTIFIMGVSGIGKTTIGAALAEALDFKFVDADDLHPAENKAKMASGIPLADDDRWPWLDAVALAAREQPSVIACSALRRRYRDRLLALVPGALFVHLEADRKDIERRIADRTHEFMPAQLLDSQLATLEPLASDEPGKRLLAVGAIEELVQAIIAELGPPVAGHTSAGPQ